MLVGSSTHARTRTQVSVLVGCCLGLALSSQLLRGAGHPGVRAMLDPRPDSWQAIMLNVSVMVGALSGLALAYFILGGRDLGGDL